MSKQYYACVYGGASDKIAKKHREEIEKLGSIICQNGFSLVYGAGATGCMGAVARGVRENGGYIMGISPNFIRTFEEIFDCDNTIMVDTMSERKTLMEKHASVFLIAPGGVGTMDEFFQVLTLKYLRRTSAPIIVLNLDGFYDRLLAFIDDMIAQGAVAEEVLTMFDVVERVDDKKLLRCFAEIKATQVDEKTPANA